MNNELKKLHFMLKRAGMHKEAQKAASIIKKAQGTRDWEQELDEMDHPFDIAYDEKQAPPAYSDLTDYEPPKWKSNLEGKKMPEPTPHHLRQKQLDNNHYGPSDYGYNFPAQGFDDPITHSLESDDEHFYKNEGDPATFDFDIPENSKQQRDLTRQVLQDEMEFSSSESKKMKEGLKNMIKQSFPPKGKVEGDGSVYDVDAKKYYAFLKRELGQKIDEIGLVSLDGTAKINVDTITNTLFDKYNKLSEARKKSMIGAMIKKGFLRR